MPKQNIVIAAFSFLVCLFVLNVSFANAGLHDLEKKISEARAAVVLMVENPDQRDAAHQKRAADTAKAVSSELFLLKVQKEKQKTLAELTTMWEAFRKTREEEFLPAILAGKNTMTMDGIQKVRYVRILELCKALSKQSKAARNLTLE